jgi:hypothetical protein
MPTTAHKNEAIEEMYEQISEMIEIKNENTNIIILGNWNIVGEAIKHS